MIRGNTIALLQVKEPAEKNSIAEKPLTWVDVTSLKGFLDYMTGDSGYQEFNAKIQESTHIFLCDFTSLKGLSKRWVWNPFSFLFGVISQDAAAPATVSITSENARMVINGKVYDILLIDNPMNRNQHLEIYLKYLGGQNGNTVH